MKRFSRIGWFLAVGLLIAPRLLGDEVQTRGTATSVDGVWKLEKLIYPSATLETQGGFIFLAGHYSTTVNYSHQGTRTNLSQFGTYSLEGSHLVLVPVVQVSTRAQSVVYEPEPPFTLEIMITGDEMRGTAPKDGTTFVFRRLR